MLKSSEDVVISSLRFSCPAQEAPTGTSIKAFTAATSQHMCHKPPNKPEGLQKPAVETLKVSQRVRLNRYRTSRSDTKSTTWANELERHTIFNDPHLRMSRARTREGPIIHWWAVRFRPKQVLQRLIERCVCSHIRIVNRKRTRCACFEEGGVPHRLGGPASGAGENDGADVVLRSPLSKKKNAVSLVTGHHREALVFSSNIVVGPNRTFWAPNRTFYWPQSLLLNPNRSFVGWPQVECVLATNRNCVGPCSDALVQHSSKMSLEFFGPLEKTRETHLTNKFGRHL